ncbi:MAG: InlB B-repeat-containing protein [Clostridia bacterium]|nr:InlB B-repeat-containing protein [Clostridia bacterium]
MKKLLCLLACILTAVCFSACKNDNGSNKIEQVNITLNLNGGTISGSTTIVADLWEDLTIPTPVKEGYNFTGWYCDGAYVNLKPFMIEKEAITLNATWSAKTYGVLLDFNGGTYVENDGSVVSKKKASATYGNSVTFPTPTREGYEFSGWYYGEEPVSTDVWDLDVGDVVIKAGWDRTTYQVKFNFNGGKLVGGDETLTETILTAKYDRTIEFPVLKKAGFKFIGWSFDGVTVLNSNLWIYEIENPELIAVFVPEQVQFVFDSNGGTLDEDSGIITYGDSTADIKAVIPEKEGFIFDCWTVGGEPIGDNFNYYPADNKSSVQLRARYTPKQYTLTLDANGGTLDGETTVTVTYGRESVIPVPTPQQGFKFIGWKIKTTGELVSSYSGTIVWAYARNEDLVARYASDVYVNFVHCDGKVETFLLDELRENAEAGIPIPNTLPGYSAVWELSNEEIFALEENTEIESVLTANTYAVIYKNGLSTVFTTFYTYNSEVILPNNSTVLPDGSMIKKSGYVLLGWSLERVNQTEYIGGTLVWDIPDNAVLYAVWAPATYRITYDLSSIKADYSMLDKDGNMVGSVQEVTFGEEYELYTLSARNNLISVKWLNGDSEMEVSGTWSLKSNITLTPSVTYNKVDIEVNLNLNGGGGSTRVTFTLAKSFRYVSKAPTAPKGKKLVGYYYKGTAYSLDDIFLIVDYDGTPFKCMYEDYISFTINIDVGEGTGNSTAVIEYGYALSTMNSLPVPPSGKKLVGFEYNGIEYDRNHVWEFASYDGDVFIAIYVEDDVDWSPSV